MKAAVTLKENYEFRRTYQKGVSAVSPVMVLYCRKNRLGRNRLGLVSSTKLGHAVVRNRCRRRLREVYRLEKPQLKTGYYSGCPEQNCHGPLAGAAKTVPPSVPEGRSDEGARMKRVLLALVRFYRRAISPFRPPCCRYTPTCSQYALEAIEKYGALKGGWMAFRRILRCNPFHKGGYDPVP